MLAPALRTLLLACCFSTASSVANAQTCRSDIPQSDSIWTTAVPGEIVDSSTLLTWKRCLAGQSWNGAGCTGTPDALTWQGALQSAPSGWRLPNIKELESLVARECVQPALNTVAFAGQPNHVAWSSTPIWSVDFADGTPLTQTSSSALLAVRYVKSSVPNAVSEYTPGAGNSATCNANIPQSRPANSLVANPDNTVTDSSTGLTWTRCAVGQTYTGGRCTGNATTLDWAAALLYADAQRAQGWRLPNVKELESLTDRQCFAPAINGEFFPDHPESLMWTSTPTWAVNFNDGVAATQDASNAFAIRLVKGGDAKAAYTRLPDRFPICAPNIATEFSQRNWLPLANGTARNIDTQLIWARCYVGQTWTGTTCAGDATPMNWQTALQTADTAAFAGAADWRLPNIKELESTADRRCYDPVTHPDVFPNSHSTTLWSSTPNWYMDATDGIVTSAIDPGATRGVRLVRGGGMGAVLNNALTDQPAIADVSTTVTLGPVWGSELKWMNRLTPTASNQKLIVVTHGWNSDADAWPNRLVALICSKVGGTIQDTGLDIRGEVGISRYCEGSNGWRVVAVNWAPRAGISSLDALLDNALSLFDFDAVSGGEKASLLLPTQALEHAKGLGNEIGWILKSAALKYDFIHAIGHSAGAGFVDQLTQSVKSNITPPPLVHNTFLDAFCWSISCTYGKEATWAEHYVDSRPLFFTKKFCALGDSFCIGVPFEPGLTNRQLLNAHNFDVRFLAGDIPGVSEGMSRNHAWPYHCYIESAGGVIRPDGENPTTCLTRSSGEPRGLSLSLENHPTVPTDAAQFLANQRALYPPGALTTILRSPSPDLAFGDMMKDTAIPYSPLDAYALSQRATVYLTETIADGIVSVQAAWHDFLTGSGTFVPSAASSCVLGGVAGTTPAFLSDVRGVSLACRSTLLNAQSKIAKRTVSATDDSAVSGWFSVRFHVGEVANLLSFDFQFVDGAESQLAVFVDDTLVHVGPATSSAGLVRVANIAMPELAVGEHRIAFRSDSVDGQPVSVEISNVRLGRQRPVACDLDVDADGILSAHIDGLILVRSMLGMTGDALFTGISTIPSPVQRQAIAARAASLVSSGLLDFDGDTNTLPSMDGILLVRSLLGYRGAALSIGAVSTTAQRSVSETLSYMKAACGLNVE